MHNTSKVSISDFLTLTLPPEAIGDLGFYPELHFPQRTHLASETTHIVPVNPGMNAFEGCNMCVLTSHEALVMTFIDDIRIKN